MGDISSSQATTYDIVDPVALKTMVTNQLPPFERQWSSMLKNVDDSFKDETCSTLYGNMVGKPWNLESYYSREKGSNSSNIKGQSGRKPYVMFGRHSVKAHMKDTQEKGVIQGNTLNKSGIGDTPAKHMICQLVAPGSPLCCARTYFTSSGQAPYPITGGHGLAPHPPKTDIELLERLYKVVIYSVLAAITEYCKTTSHSKAEACCLSSLEAGHAKEKLKLDPGFLTNKANIDFTLEALTHEGNTIELIDDKVPLIKLVSLVVYDIPSIEHPNNSVGSVVFAESFFDSAIPVLQEDGSIKMNTESLILTRHLPRTITWAVKMEPIKFDELINDFSKGPFGRVLLNGVGCSMLGSVELSTPSKGVLYVYEKGIIFRHPRNVLTVLEKRWFTELQFYDGGSAHRALACLVITYKQIIQRYQPLQNHNTENNTENMVMFTFKQRNKSLNQKTDSYKKLLTEVIGRWQQKQENEAPVLKQVDVMPEYYANTYKELQHSYIHEKDASSVPPLIQANVNLPTLNSFLSHLSVSSVDPAPVREADLPSILEPSIEQSQPSSDPDEVVITLLTGITGSHKEALCTALTNLTKDNNKLSILRAPFGVPHAYNQEKLEASLTDIVTAARQQRASIRVLIMTPGFTDTVSVVSAILNHPNADIRGSLKLGAVTACVDAPHIFMEHRMTFPLLLDQCAQGWVNNILLTSCTKGPDTEFIQELLRNVNSDVAFIITNPGEILSGGDAELILSKTAFMEPSKVRARHLLIPQWRSPEFSRQLTPAMTEVSLNFSQPLYRSRLLPKMISLCLSLVPSPFQGNIYHIEARTRFNESSQVMELTYSTMTGHLTEVHVPAATAPLPPGGATSNGRSAEAEGDNNDHEGPQHCFMFTGCGLQETTLREWLSACFIN